jgi:hypothetical protein
VTLEDLGVAFPAGEHPGVELGLLAVEVVDRLAELPAPAHRLDLLHHQGAVGVPAQAVEAAHHGHLPAAVAEGVAHPDLAAVGGVLLESLLLVPAVDRLAEPEPLVAPPVGESQAAGELPVQQVRHRQLEGQAVGVEAGRHGERLYGTA